MMARSSRFILLFGLLTLLSACVVTPPQPRQRVEAPPPVPSRPEPPPRPVPPPVTAIPAPPVEQPQEHAMAPIPREFEPAPPATRPTPPVASPPPAASVALPAAAKTLVTRAEASSKAGRFDEAAAYLERALRIAPRHPLLWQKLAQVRYRQKDYAKVEGLAMKSNAFAPQDATLRRENWELIASVRRARGDARGAEAAAEEARRLAW